MELAFIIVLMNSRLIIVTGLIFMLGENCYYAGCCKMWVNPGFVAPCLLSILVLFYFSVAYILSCYLGYWLLVAGQSIAWKDSFSTMACYVSSGTWSPASLTLLDLIVVVLIVCRYPRRRQERHVKWKTFVSGQSTAALTDGFITTTHARWRPSGTSRRHMLTGKVIFVLTCIL